MFSPDRSLRVLALALLLLALPAVVSAASESGEFGVILVGCDDNYPPYEFVDENGEPTGFNVDLIREVAHRRGLDIRITARPWNEIRTALEEGRIDVLSGMVYSPERDRAVDFSIPRAWSSMMSPSWTRRRCPSRSPVPVIADPSGTNRA
ncbi:MAG: transporter substrate-binding domain-containing protein [Methanomicrobiales archaeon]